MAAKTAWSGGALGSSNGAYVAAFNSGDMNSLAYQSSVMSGIIFDNTIATLGTPDQFMDVSFTGALATAAVIPNGAGLGLWLYVLQRDGTTFGGGRLLAGTAAAFSPMLNPLGGIPVEAWDTASTPLAGSALSLPIPPRAFRLVIQNTLGTGLTLAASGNMLSIATYCQNTNA
jgi:hypothetical protein